MLAVKLWLVFVSAVLALSAYVWLALHGVAWWGLLPLLAYMVWAQIWLWTAGPHD